MSVEPQAEPAGWWLSFLETDDEGRRRAIVEQAIRVRLKRSRGDSSPKNELRSQRDAWELSWDLCRHDNPIDVLEHFEGAIRARALEDEEEAPRPGKTGERVPPADPALAAFLRSDAAREARLSWKRRVAEKKLLGWLESTAEAPAAESHNLALSFHLQPTAELPRLALTVHLASDAGKSPLGLASLTQLAEDARHGRKKLDPAERRLLEWILARGAGEEPRRERSAEQEARVRLRPAEARPPQLLVRNPLEWAQALGRERSLCWEDGAEVEIEPRLASIGLAERPGAAPVWAVELGDEQIALDRAALFVSGQSAEGGRADAPDVPALFVRRGGELRRVDTHDMPLDLVAMLVAMPELPLERLRHTAAGAALARRVLAPRRARRKKEVGGPIAEPPSALVHEVPVRPFVELRLENELAYVVSSGARAQDGAEFERSHAGVWSPRNLGRTISETPRPALAEIGRDQDGALACEAEADSPEARARALALVPRKEDVGPLDAWLRRLVPAGASTRIDESGRPAFAWKADAHATMRLVRHWLARPSGVMYLGDGPFAKLVKIQDAPRIHLETREGGIDWLEVSVELEDELESLSLSDIAGALDSSEDEILMVQGTRLYRREHLERYLSEMESLCELGLAPRAGFQRLHLRELEASAGGRTIVRHRPGDDRLRALAERSRALAASFKGIPHAPVPEPASSFLRSYQRAGVDFLSFATTHLGGALLADDMGLGKTLQTLSTILALRALHAERGLEALPALVICPASVSHNWRREAARFAPDLKVLVVEGGEKRKALLTRLDEWDLVIENSALIRRDVETLKEREFLVVAVDEAQSIKNPGADTTQAVKQLRARHRIALTGTPIENRLTDLWSIVDFAVPGYMGSLASFERLVKEQDAPVVHKMLRGRLRPLLLRRLKREVAPELPDRIEERLDCEMTEAQKLAYLSEVKRTRLLLEGLENPDDLSGRERVQMLAALTRLRQICCEPSLVDLPERGSGKVEELLALLPELLESGHKVLVFSQFVRMLDFLSDRFRERNLPFRVLTGATVDRMAVVDEFEKDPRPSIFLISLKAGGTGLNLTSASHVVLFDPWWSPALEAQAIDRSHRIGQKKTVVAVRMVTKGTIEERILELQERKLGLVKDILEAGTLEPTLTADDLSFLLAEDDDAMDRSTPGR